MAVRRTRVRAALTGVGITARIRGDHRVLWLGAHQVLAGAMTGGQLAQFLLYAAFVGTSAAALSEMWGEVQRAAGAMERLAELLEAQPAIARTGAPLGAAATRARRRFDSSNVSFHYPSRPESCGAREFQSGGGARRDDRVRGAVGRGQEHDLSAAAALLRPGCGPRVDRWPATSRNCARRTSAPQIGLVPQDTVLFGASARENIRYGRPGASDEEIEAAARRGGGGRVPAPAAARVRHVPRRTRHAAFGRAAPAHRARACDSQESADSAAR